MVKFSSKEQKKKKKKKRLDSSILASLLQYLHVLEIVEIPHIVHQILILCIHKLYTSTLNILKYAQLRRNYLKYFLY